MDEEKKGKMVRLIQDVVEVLEAAAAPPELKPAAFQAIFQFLTEGPRESLAPHSSGELANVEPVSSDRLAVLANRLGVERTQAEYVFDVSGNEVTLVAARSRLPSGKRAATRQIAVLYAAARQAVLDEEWTRAEALREQVRLFGVLDSSNFASALASAGDSLLLRGQGTGRSVKVTRAGFEEAAKIVRELSP